jgi:hypothetical protein
LRPGGIAMIAGPPAIQFREDSKSGPGFRAAPIVTTTKSGSDAEHTSTSRTIYFGAPLTPGSSVQVTAPATAPAAGTTPSAKVLSHPTGGPFLRELSGVVRMPSVVDYGAASPWYGAAARLQAVQREDSSASSSPSLVPSVIEVGIPPLRMDGRNASQDAHVPEECPAEAAETEQQAKGRRRKLDCSCCA